MRLLFAAWSCLLIDLVLACSPHPKGSAAHAGGKAIAPARVSDTGLLFYLSGSRGTEADFSNGGTPKPNVVGGVSRVENGAKGPALQCEHTQVLSYWAPGNIRAQRGTLSFFWRAREALGKTEFPLFRVAFADHSSWDMTWLRIDYNGHGFDAFVTDAYLSRTRVSVSVDPLPSADAWTHLALAWDETLGIRLWVNGKLSAERQTSALLDVGLDQFGPHSRIISPLNVQSDYNFVRGGDLDELRIYDRMLDDAQVVSLSRGDAPQALSPLPARDLDDPRVRDEWWGRYGWNGPGYGPPYLAGPAVAVRKVAIHDAYDQKRWWWKANDGIRETTWPGVYNRSRLPGRSDYFTLLDWDCYSTSGGSVTFTLPNEPWNALQIEGAAWGKMSSVDGERLLFERPKGQARSFHQFATALTGGRIRFDNAEPEEPIAELNAFLVKPGKPPKNRRTASYRLGRPNALSSELQPLAAFIQKRHPEDERALLIAEPVTSQPTSPAQGAKALPIVHVLIPAPETNGDGLDGLVLELPALSVRATHGALFPLNIQVKDPLWPARNWLDFSFSVKPNEKKSIAFDLRDRILPPGQPLYLSIAAAGQDFGLASLQGSEIRFVFKPAAEAQAEHELDRFTEVRDVYAMMVEERPADPRFNLYNRFAASLGDLLRVNPSHELGLKYAAAANFPATKPAFLQPEPPKGVPLWAFRQVTALAGVQRLVHWYIDNRQIESGEFGGGLSDDADLTNMWPGSALMGTAPEKIQSSLRRLLDAVYANGMLERGLPAAQADELHGYEEGINAIGQNLLLDYGSPRQLERAMETARGVETLTGVNAAGHRHFRSSYYSATRVAEDGVWAYGKAYMYLLLQPSLSLGEYNGNPKARELVIALADGLLAHGRREGDRYVLPRAIHFASDKESGDTRDFFPWPLFWAAWKWTHDKKYLEPILGRDVSSILAVSADLLDELGVRDEWGPRILSGEESKLTEHRAPGDVRGNHRGNAYRTSSRQHFEWQLTGDKRRLEELYGNAIERTALLEYINTEGSIWIDRVALPYADLQRARLGGVALVRNSIFPGHVIGWRFETPARATSVAVLVPFATPKKFDVIAYNLEKVPVRAALTLHNVDPGRWTLTQGLDGNDDDKADRAIARRVLELERGSSVPLTLPARATTVLHFELTQAGVAYAARPDLGIERGDIGVSPKEIRVRIHSIGSVVAPPTRIVFRDRTGTIRATAELGEMPAPLDLVPKTQDVVLTLPAGVELSKGNVEIDPERKLREITRLNNVVELE